MQFSLALLAPFALLVPAIGGELALPSPAVSAPASAPAEVRGPEAFVHPAEKPVAHQVRIEQRVTIRIAPRDPAIRPSIIAELGRAASAPSRLAERKMGKCVPVSGIAAVQPDGSRLLLFMRDQRLVAASLEKACRPRDFYSGFYLERTGDGLLCVERDKLHSRAGASCAVSKMRQLVVADD